jgi:nitroreductase
MARPRSSSFPQTLDPQNANSVPFSNAAIMAYSMNLAATALGYGSCLIWGTRQ